MSDETQRDIRSSQSQPKGPQPLDVPPRSVQSTLNISLLFNQSKCRTAMAGYKRDQSASHGFAAYPRPYRCSGRCPFLQRLPPEIRLSVYSYLFPDREIPWTLWRDTSLRWDGSKVYSAILCTNKQINREATPLLYGKVPFVVGIDELFIRLVDTRIDQLPASRFMGPDYQQRVLTGMISPAEDWSCPSVASQLSILEGWTCRSDTCKRLTERDLPLEPAFWREISSRWSRRDLERGEREWCSALQPTALERIRHFRLHIAGPKLSGIGGCGGAPSEQDKVHQFVLSNIAKLVDALNTVKPHILTLDMALEMVTSQSIAETFPLALTILQPFDQLRNVRRPRIRSIMYKHEQPIPTHFVELLLPDFGDRQMLRGSLTFNIWYHRWSTAMMSGEVVAQTEKDQADSHTSEEDAKQGSRYVANNQGSARRL